MITDEDYRTSMITDEDPLRGMLYERALERSTCSGYYPRGVMRYFICCKTCSVPTPLFSLFFTLGTGPRRSLSLNLGDTRVYVPTPGVISVGCGRDVGRAQYSVALGFSTVRTRLQGYLAHKKLPPPRTLQ